MFTKGKAKYLKRIGEINYIEANNFYEMLLKYHKRHPEFRINLVMTKLYTKSYFIFKKHNNN